MNPFLFLLPLAFVCAAIHLLMTQKQLNNKLISEILLFYVLTLCIGVNSLFMYYEHVFTPHQIAGYIGWPPDSPFQQEVGYANLAFGILGILCFFFRGLFWVATVFGVSIWYWGNAYGHIIDCLHRQNEAPGNIGLPLYIDTFLPFLLIILLIGYLYNPNKSKHE